MNGVPSLQKEKASTFLPSDRVKTLTPLDSINFIRLGIGLNPIPQCLRMDAAADPGSSDLSSGKSGEGRLNFPETHSLKI
ncbi:hypothetical protein D3C87_1616870 [compost metagenome]